jgi:hypothetical protein
MMTLDHDGDQEAMVYAQLGQQPLARTTETSLEPRPGTLSCLSARPPDLATATAAQPEVACVRPSIVPFLYSKRTAAARSPGSRYGRLNVLWPLRADHSWNYPHRGALHYQSELSQAHHSWNYPLPSIFNNHFLFKYISKR